MSVINQRRSFFRVDSHQHIEGNLARIRELARQRNGLLYCAVAFLVALTILVATWGKSRLRAAQYTSPREKRHKPNTRYRGNVMICGHAHLPMIAIFRFKKNIRQRTELHDAPIFQEF